MSGKPYKNILTTQQKSKEVKGISKKQVATDIPKWAPLAVLVFTALLYSRALYNGFVSLDDYIYIPQNPFIKDFSWNGMKAIFTSFYSGNYHPLTMLSYLLEYSLFGLNPLPYHLLSVLLHLLNIWLVFKLVEELSDKKITALVVALLFAVHPMHVESVAWISERKDVLYSLFYLLSLLIYLRYLKSGLQTKYYIAALLIFVASLLSKPAAVTLPVLLIAIDIYKGRTIQIKLLLEKIPFLLLALLFGILAVWSQGTEGAVNDAMLSYGFINKIFLFTSALAFYLLKSIAPFGLSAMHYFPNIHNGLFPCPYYASLPFVLFIAWLLVKSVSFRKEIIFGVFFFLITVSVMLQVFPVGASLVSERYTYIPYMGLFYIAGQWMADIRTKEARNAVAGLFSFFVIMFSVQTWERISVWKNDDALYNDIVEKNPDIYFGYYLRGNLKNSQGKLQEALQDYTQAIRLKNPELAELYTSRGLVYYNLGDKKSAMLDYNKAIELNPEMAEAYNNRGAAYFGLGNIKSALIDLNKAILLNPKLDNAYYNRGVLKAKTCDTIGSCEDLKKAVQLGNQEAAQMANQYCN